MTIDAELHALATGKNFAALTTLASDGHPRTQIMWIDADDEHVLINTETHRAKFHDLQGDPRVTVTIFDPAKPYQYIEVRGRVVSTEAGPAARDHIDSLARRYFEQDSYPWPVQSERVIVRVAPDRIHKHGY